MPTSDVRDPTDPLPPEVDDLYAAPPGRFVGRRDHLVERLRAHGRTDEAVAVRRLRRPTVGAWAVNQLALRHPDLLDELADDAARVAEAQRTGGSGLDAEWRERVRAQRRRADDLTERAARWVVDEGVSTSDHRDEIAATLELAASDPRVAHQVRRGRLRRLPARPSDPFVGLPEPDGRRPRRGRRRDEEGRARAASAALDRARAELARRERALDDLEERIDRARSAREGARRRLAELERMLSSA